MTDLKPTTSEERAEWRELSNHYDKGAGAGIAHDHARCRLLADLERAEKEIDLVHQENEKHIALYVDEQATRHQAERERDAYRKGVDHLLEHGYERSRGRPCEGVDGVCIYIAEAADALSKENQ